MRKSLIISVLLLPGIVLADENAAVTPGCLIETVRHGSPADAAGLKQGDLIVEASSVTIRSAQDLQNAVTSASADLSITFHRGTNSEHALAHLEPDNSRGYRLGVVCADERSNSLGQLSLGDRRPEIYIGPSFSWLSLAGDFNGNHLLFNPQTGNVAAVPSFNDAAGFGGVIGMRSPLRDSNVDLAMEANYQQGSMDNFLGGTPNNEKATLREFGITFKTYFSANRSVQPVIGGGVDFPWLVVPGGVINPFYQIEDETFRGIGWHVGGGFLCYIARQVSLEAFVAYHQRRFNSLNGEKINNPVVSSSFEPSLTIRYHFSLIKRRS